MSNKARPSVCLVDDDAGVRDAFRLLMKTSGLKLITFNSANEFLANFEPRNVGCIVLDVRMPGMTGMELQEILHQRKNHVPVIILTGHADVPLAVQAVKHGAQDVIEKPFKDDLILEAIHKAFAVYDGCKKIEADRRSISDRLSRLTPRELEVLDLMVGGRTNKAIAEHLGISRKTLDIHRSKVMEKMEARTTADLVRFRLLEKYPPASGSLIKEYDLL